MLTKGNEMISALNRVIERAGPLATVLDGVVDRIAPKATAQASCPPGNVIFCSYYCTTCCANCGGDYKQNKTYNYTYFIGGCNTQYMYSCTFCDYC